MEIDPLVEHSRQRNFLRGVTLIGAFPVEFDMTKFIRMSSQFMWESTQSRMGAKQEKHVKFDLQ